MTKEISKNAVRHKEANTGAKYIMQKDGRQHEQLKDINNNKNSGPIRVEERLDVPL